jgi:hypothetical protein
MASAFPTVASFWKYRCAQRYHPGRHLPGMELAQQAPRTLYSLRYWVNVAYMDFVQLLQVDYTQAFGCQCAGRHGVPRRVVFDGNSLAYRAASAWL